MLGAAPSQAQSESTHYPRTWGRWFGAASIVLVALVVFPALAGAAARFEVHGRVTRNSSAATVAASHRTKVEALPRLWSVQVSPGRRGWFDRAVLKRVSEDGINALTLRISALGRKRAAKGKFDSVRKFAAGEKLYLIAVLPTGKLRTPAARRALAACSSHRFSRLRCAVQARSSAAAARLARKHNSVRRLVAVYVKGPRRFSGPAGLRGSVRRPVLAVAPLYRRFDISAWGAAVGQTAANASVDMGVAPKDSAALERFAAMLSRETGSTAGAPSDTTPSTPSGLATRLVTASSLTLSWDASTDDVGVAGYRLFENGTQVGTSSATSYSFTGLSCGTSYTLGVAAYDAAGNLSGTATTTRSTSACADTQPPSMPTGLAISSVGSAAVMLSWNASADNVGVTGYRLFVNGIQVGSSLTTSYLFSGLSCQTAYTLGVAAADAAGNASPVATTIAQTAACSDTQPPSTPAGLATSGLGQTSVTLSWSASTDNVGVAGYRLFLNGSQVGSSNSTNYSFTGLTCGTSYTLGVAAYDAAGNLSGTATAQKSTTACPDTQPPSTPSGLGTSSVTQTSMNLSWNASSDNVGVIGYRLYVNGSLVGTATSTSYSFTGLTCGASYTLGVAAYDAAGNGSGTATVSQSTSSCPDTQPPSTPTGLAVSGVGQSSVTLSWKASSDNVGVGGYRLFLDGSQVGGSSSTSYSFTGLTCGTSYTLGVAAYDAAGNVSGTATVSQATSACSGSGVSGEVYMSPSGNDASCVRGNAAKPCATLAGAYAVAQSGDTVLVAPGTYSLAGSQTLPYDSSKVNSSLSSPCPDSDRVTFESTGSIQADGSSSDPMFSVPTKTGDGLEIFATCLTFNGVDFNAEVVVAPNGGPSSNPSSITFENARFDRNMGYSGGDPAFFGGGNYITLKNIEFGPVCCNNDGLDFWSSNGGDDYGVTLDHVFIHDILTDCSQLSNLASWPSCSSQSSAFNGAHVDCVQTLGMGDWTVENSRILNCTGGGGASLQQGVYPDNSTYFDVLWENNVIDTDQFGMGCGGTCISTYGNSYMFKATVPPGYPDSGTKSYFKVLYNTIQVSTGGEDMQPGGDYESIGNIEQDAGDGTGCGLPATQGEGAGAVWSNTSYNLFTDHSYGSSVAAACNKYGTHNTSGTPSYVDSADGNWQLAAGSAGIDAGPSSSGPDTVPTDILGNTRPCGTAWTLGAYEYGCNGG